jgi:gamma-glutamyltranspeptidase/glutathione hydrolase
MDDFSIKPGASNSYGLTGNDINAIGPRRRMVSSMTPTIVSSPRGTAVMGTPGGSRIVSMVFLATLAWLDGAEPDAIVSMPRFHHQHFPDQILYETNALTPEEIAGLEARGHSLREVRRGYGNMQIVVIDGETGAATAASDPRGKVVGRVY